MLWKEDYNKCVTWEFENECEKYRKTTFVTEKQINNLEKLREQELKNIYDGQFNPSLQLYFNLVNEYEWNEKICKDKSYYHKLTKVFV